MHMDVNAVLDLYMVVTNHSMVVNNMKKTSST